MSGTIVSDTNPLAIESGSSWNGFDTAGAPVIVTFSFPTALPAYDDSIGGFTPATVASFSAFNSNEQAQAIAAMQQWAAASGIVFLEVPAGEGDITFANVSFSTTDPSSPAGDYRTAGGIGFYPFSPDWSFLTGSNSTGFGFPSDLNSAGDVFMNSDFIGNVNTGTVDLGTLLHEIGHAIGLKHPDQVVFDPNGTVHGSVLDPTHNSGTLTIMSETGDGGGAGATLFSLDKSAAAALYGKAGTGAVVTSTTVGSNSVSTWSWNSGTDTLTQTAVSANETIYGTSVNDVIYGFGYGGSVATVGTISLFGLDGTNTLYAGSGTANLYGGPGTNTLIGGPGDNNFYVYSTKTTITDAYTSGNNTLFASGVDATLPENVRTLQLFGSGLTGTGNDQDDSIFGDGTFSNTLIAGSGNDYMAAGSGGNTLVAGTGIDRMFGGTGANSFVFAPGDAPVNSLNGIDSIGDFKPGTDKIDLSAFARAGHPLSFIGSGALTGPGQVDVFTMNGTTFIEGDVTNAHGPDFEIALDGSLTLHAGDFKFGTPCYVLGTFITTDRGEIAVENLTEGDRVLTISGTHRPIRWIGNRRIDCSRHPDPRLVWPICVTAGAFGEDLPYRDLWLSPDHAVYVQDVLVPIKLLINFSTVRQIPMNAVTYYHVELSQHDILLADGLPAESYLDTGNRHMFENGGASLLLHPFMEPENEQARREAGSCVPLVCDAEHVEPIWRSLAARAEWLGFSPQVAETTDDPVLCMCVDGRSFNPISRVGNRYLFALSNLRNDVRLVSRSAAPSHMRPWVDDQRQLGVAIQRIAVQYGEQFKDVALDDPRLVDGWYGVERDNAKMWRWTNGNAVLGIEGDRVMVEVMVCGTLHYPMPERRTEVMRKVA